MSPLVQNAWSSIAWARGVGKRSLRIANIAVLSDIGVRARGEKKGGEKKIISTGSLLADPISGSTVDGQRCLRVDRIAFFVGHVYTVFVLRRIWEASVLARPFLYEFLKRSFLRK